MATEYYAILYKGERFMPFYKKRVTHSDPKSWSGPPRLFAKLGTARGVLTIFCKGPLMQMYDNGRDLGLKHDSEHKRPREDFSIIYTHWEHAE